VDSLSHFDDIDFVFWGDSPATAIGALIFLVIAGIAIYWAYSADHKSEQLCTEHGEKYVDSRENYTLCERPDGTVVRR
jgi:hypothetical protein